MKKQSDVEQEILAHLRAQGGQDQNAKNLIMTELGRAWCHGYRSLCNLERRGLVTIQRRGRGVPMTITLAGRHE